MLRTFSTKRFAIRSVVTFARLLVASVCAAQSSESYHTPPGPFHQPVSPLPVELGFTQHHASTAAEGFQRGQASVIQALGNFELSESQAEILRQQARWAELENNLKQTQTLHAKQKLWAEARTQALKSRSVRRSEGLKLIAERRATEYRQAYQLSASELDIATGAICWPAALQAEKYQLERGRIEQLFRQHLSYEEPQSVTANEIVRSIDRLSRTLRSDFSSLPRDDYMASQKFLAGLKGAATSLVKAS